MKFYLNFLFKNINFGEACLLWRIIQVKSVNIGVYQWMKRIYENPLNNRILNFSSKIINKLIPDYLYGKGYTYYLSKNKNLINAYFCFWKDYERRKIFNQGIRQQLNINEAELIKESIIRGTNADFISKMQSLDMQTYLVNDILTKVDRSSMMNSLEARVPILDHKFAELSFKIPSTLKLNGTNKKYILKEAFKDILPSDIITHKKQGFAIPLSNWFKGNLKVYAFDNLLNNSKLSKYLNPKQIKLILENHQKGIRDYSAKLWSLLILNEWLIQNR